MMTTADVPCNIADAAKETVDPFLLSMCQHYAHVGQGGLVLTFIVTSAAVKNSQCFHLTISNVEPEALEQSYAAQTGQGSR